MFRNLTDPIARLVLVTGITVIIISALLFLLTLCLRFFLIIKEKRRRQFVSLWQPLMQECVVETPAELPRIRPSDIDHFLLLWNYYHESLLGEAKQRLNALARAAGIDRVTLRMLNTRRLPARLMAVVTLGNLEERSVWAELRNLAATDNAFLSLAAARALLQINPTMAMPVMAPLIAWREDWPRTKVVNILREVGAEIFAVPLVHEIATAPPANAARLIRYLEATRCAVALPLLRECLKQRPENDEVTAASLRLYGQLQDPWDLDTLRGFVAHPTWFVRLAAGISIGRMGTIQDDNQLQERLSDEFWWVRFRAAEAIAGLPYMTPERLRQIDAEQSNPLAKEMLTPYLARCSVAIETMGSAANLSTNDKLN